MRNHSNENEFDLHENEHASETNFHMNGFAPRLVLRKSQKSTRKWPINILPGVPLHIKPALWLFPQVRFSIHPSRSHDRSELSFPPHCTLFIHAAPVSWPWLPAAALRAVEELRYPNCRQTTSASGVSHCSSQTQPQVLLK